MGSKDLNNLWAAFTEPDSPPDTRGVNEEGRSGNNVDDASNNLSALLGTNLPDYVSTDDDDESINIKNETNGNGESMWYLASVDGSAGPEGSPSSQSSQNVSGIEEWATTGSVLAVGETASSGVQGGGLREDGEAMTFFPPPDCPSDNRLPPQLVFNRADLDGRSSLTEDNVGYKAAVDAVEPPSILASISMVEPSPQTTKEADDCDYSSEVGVAAKRPRREMEDGGRKRASSSSSTSTTSNRAVVASASSVPKDKAGLRTWAMAASSAGDVVADKEASPKSRRARAGNWKPAKVLIGAKRPRPRPTMECPDIVEDKATSLKVTHEREVNRLKAAYDTEIARLKAQAMDTIRSLEAQVVEANRIAQHKSAECEMLREQLRRADHGQTAAMASSWPGNQVRDNGLQEQQEEAAFQTPQLPMDEALSSIRVHLGGKDHLGRDVRWLEQQSRNTLENTHDFIQVFFPTREASRFVPGAPVVQGATLAFLEKNPLQRALLKKNLARVLKAMLAFYGLEMVAGRVHLMSHETQWLNTWSRPGNHNALRLTRVMASLGLFGLDEEANALRAFLMESLPGHPSQAFWAMA